jgi:DNA polymerase elongation subunit (family B)
MFTPKELSQILFLDIETAALVAHFDDLPLRMQEAWIHESRKIRDEEYPGATASEKFNRHAAFYAEFGRVICISAAFLNFMPGKGPELIIKSFCSSDERLLLTAFGQMLDKQKRCTCLCAHNGREFDYPFIGKRFLIKGLPLPKCLSLRDRAGWETRHLMDTMALWRFSSWKEYRRLELICAVLDIPTPKDDIDGSMVSELFWKHRDLSRIAQYCQKDVIALAQVVLRLSSLPLIIEENILCREGLPAYGR